MCTGTGGRPHKRQNIFEAHMRLPVSPHGTCWSPPTKSSVNLTHKSKKSQRGQPQGQAMKCYKSGTQQNAFFHGALLMPVHCVLQKGLDKALRVRYHYVYENPTQDRSNKTKSMPFPGSCQVTGCRANFWSVLLFSTRPSDEL